MTTIHIAGDWLEAVRASLGQRADLVSRFESAMPAGYDELNDPTIAALDFVNIDALHRSGAEICTNLLQRADGTWRFRIYRRGESIPLADMLPLLDHLGLRALDERACRRAFEASTVWLQDGGVAAPGGAHHTETLRAEVKQTFRAE